MYLVKNARAHTAGDDALALAQCLSKALAAEPGQRLGLAEELRAVVASGGCYVVDRESDLSLCG